MRRRRPVVVERGPCCTRPAGALWGLSDGPCVGTRPSIFAEPSEGCDGASPFGTNLRDTGLFSRLGQGRMRATPASKSRIVGIPPFLNLAKEAGRDGLHPFWPQPRENRRISRLGPALDAGRIGTQIMNRWKMAVSESRGEESRGGMHPLSGHDPQDTGVSPGWGWPWAQTVPACRS